MTLIWKILIWLNLEPKDCIPNFKTSKMGNRYWIQDSSSGKTILSTRGREWPLWQTDDLRKLKALYFALKLTSLG